MINPKTVLDKVANFDYRRLIPKGRVDRYDYGAVGVELTWREGFGLGLGLGRYDLWVGWPTDKNFVSKIFMGVPEAPRPEALVGEIV